MSMHIGAEKNQIAPFVLVPGDPIRAEKIAETFFENPVCHSKVRGMFGYTGMYNGKRASTQGTGMGIPSHSIYVTELIKYYGCQSIIRIGTAGAVKENIPCGTVIIANGSYSDSNMNNVRFGLNKYYYPEPDIVLLNVARNFAMINDIPCKVGELFSSDFFYDPTEEERHKDYALKACSEHDGVLGVEMETHELYTLGKIHGVEKLSL